MPKITPIFLFSLPRSGSTLVQRVLSKNNAISTTAEPWLLLPLLSMTKEGASYSAYDSRVSSVAISELVNKLSGGRKTYNMAIESMVTQLYSELSQNNTRYFLDKTPRYHFVINEVHEVFPSAKFIYLWRNPLSIVASSINTWGKKGRWNVYNMKVDLYKGLLDLVESFKKHKSTSFAIRYEDLVLGQREWEKIFKYLDIHMDDDYLNDIGITRVEGSMGDKTGVKDYEQICDNSVNKWKSVLNNPFRKFWARRYLQNLGADNLKLMGYDLDSLLIEISNAPITYKYCISDIFCMTYGVLFHLFDIKVVRDKWIRFRGKKMIYGNS